MKKYIAELLGVFFFTLIAGLSMDPLAIGAGLAVLSYMLASISGAHLNPAITLSLLVSKKMKFDSAILYRAAQVLGAILGALVIWLLRGTTMSLMPMDGISLWVVGLAEFLFTLLLVVVYQLAFSRLKAENNAYRGAVIGLAMFVGILSLARISGGLLNPSVYLGGALVDWLHGGVSGIYLRMYLVSTLAGGAAASCIVNRFERAEKHI